MLLRMVVASSSRKNSDLSVDLATLTILDCPIVTDTCTHVNPSNKAHLQQSHTTTTKLSPFFYYNTNTVAVLHVHMLVKL